MGTKVTYSQETLQSRTRSQHLSAQGLNAALQDQLLNQFSSLLNEIAVQVSQDSFKSELKREEQATQKISTEQSKDSKQGENIGKAAPEDLTQNPEMSSESEELPADAQLKSEEELKADSEESAEEQVAQLPELADQISEDKSPEQVLNQAALQQAAVTQANLPVEETVAEDKIEIQAEVTASPQQNPNLNLEHKEERTAEVGLNQVAPTLPVEEAPTQTSQVVAANAEQGLSAAAEHKDQVVNVDAPKTAQSLNLTTKQIDTELVKADQPEQEFHQALAAKIAEHINERLNSTAVNNMRSSGSEARVNPVAAEVLAPGFLMRPEIKTNWSASSNILNNAQELTRVKGMEQLRSQVNPAAQNTNTSAFTQQRSANSSSEAQQESSRANRSNASRSEPQRALERVQATIKEVAKSKDGKTISLRLDPPNLGTVKVDLSLREGMMHARLVAENPAINNMLRERAHEIQQLLRECGVEADSVSVSVGGEYSSADEYSRQLDREQRAKGQNFGALLGTANSWSDAKSKAVQSAQVVEDHWVA